MSATFMLAPVSDPAPAPDPRAVGARIRQARKELGLNQRELAARASFGRRSLQSYERGDILPYDHLPELEQLLVRSRQWLLYGDNSTPPPLEARLARIEAMELHLIATLEKAESEAMESRRQAQELLTRLLRALENAGIDVPKDVAGGNGQ
jgi:transcriptional regulator with XRE-family HTH domain